MNFERITQNSVALSPQAWMMRQLVSEQMQTNVSVPGVLINNLFAFEFIQEAERLDLLKEQSMDAIVGLANLVSKLDDNLSDDALVEIIEKSQLNLYMRKASADDDTSEPDYASYVESARKLKAKITERMFESGLSNLLLKDAVANYAPDPNLKDLTFESIVEGIQGLQSYFNKFARAASVEEINAYVADNLWTVKAMVLVRSLYKQIIEADSPSMMARLSYVNDQVWMKLFDKKLYKQDTLLKGSVYQVGINDKFYEGLTYSNAFAGYIMSVRVIMGFDSSTAGSQRNLSEMVDELVSSTSEFIPFVSSDLGPIDEAAIKEHMMKRWLTRVITRICTNDFGSFVSRVEAISDQRRYKRSDAYDANLRDGTVVSSILLESFLDVAAEMKELVTNESILYKTLHPTKRKKNNDWYFKFLDKMMVFQGSSDRPRFMYEPNHVLSHPAPSINPLSVKWIVPDSAYAGATSTFDNLETLDRMFLLKGDQVAGFEADCKIKGNQNLLLIPPTFKPVYYFELPAPMLLKTDALSSLTAIMPYSDLHTKTDIGRFLAGRCSVESYLSMEELARAKKLPDVIAKHIFKSNEKLYASFPKGGALLYLVDPDDAPIYEFNVPESTFLVQPFIGAYPYMLKAQLGSPSDFGASGVAISTPKGPKTIDPNKGSSAPKPSHATDEDMTKSTPLDKSQDASETSKFGGPTKKGSFKLENDKKTTDEIPVGGDDIAKTVGEEFLDDKKTIEEADDTKKSFKKRKK